MNILYIKFQFGDFFHSGDESNWWLDLLNSIVGAAIGSGVTIWALYRTFKQDKINDGLRREQFQNEKVNYFQSLLKSINSGLEIQIQHLKTYSETVAANPVELPLLTFVPLNELNRVVNQLDQEDYYHSYLQKFGDSQEAIDEFRDIISTLNYFEGDLNIIKDSLMRSFEFDHERKLALKNIIEKAMDDAAGFLVNNEVIESHGDFWEFINIHMVEFSEKKPEKSDLKFHYENFIVPLKSGLIEFAKHIPLAHQLIIQLKNASNSYESIILHNNDVAIDFERLHEKMGIEYKKFQPRIKRLFEMRTH